MPGLPESLRSSHSLFPTFLCRANRRADVCVSACTEILLIAPLVRI